MAKLNDLLTDPKLLFPTMEIALFFIFPYTIGLFRPKFSLLSFPTPWMLGMGLFAIASYFVGVLAYNRWLGFRMQRQLREIERLLLLIVLYVLTSRLLFLWGLPLTVSIIAALPIGAVIHFAASASLSDKRSLIIVIASLVAVLGNFIIMGGVPLLDASLLNQAKLSVVREVALPLFLLGAVSISLGPRKTRLEGYIVQSILFGIGGLIFLLNGKRLDVLTILLCFIILLLRRHDAKVSLAIISVLLFSVLGVILFGPSYLGLFRQEFNFQVLRHITYFVQDPLLGTTHGAVSLGVRQNFLGSELIYGPDEQWTLTATWLGPAYLDLGLTGIFITMSIVAVLLELLYRKSGKGLKPEAIYIVTLTILLSLYEEGADLVTIIFALTMLYASTFGSLLKDEGANSVEVIDKIFKTGKGKLTLVLLVVGMLTITYAFMAEFRFSTAVVERGLVGDPTVLHAQMEAKYYHVELMTSKTADYVEGKLQLLGSNGILHEFSFNGLFWEAVRDKIDVAWLRPPTEGEYALRLFIERPERLERTSLILEVSPLSDLMPNYGLLDLGIGICVASLVVIVYEFCKS